MNKTPIRVSETYVFQSVTALPQYTKRNGKRCKVGYAGRSACSWMVTFEDGTTGLAFSRELWPAPIEQKET